MTTHAVRAGAWLDAHDQAPAWTHLRWLGGGLALAFGVPYVFADTLELPRDLYYGVYGISVAALFLLWARSTRQSLGPMFRRRRLTSLLLGLAAAGLLVLVVWGKHETARPDGLEFVAAVLWRGLFYGAADGLLLSVFPILAVFAIFAGTRARERLAGTVAVGFAALAASLAMTTVYHLGYRDFRSEKVRQPVAGDVVWSAPTLLTLNPLGAIVAHAGPHVAAVIHSYDTDLFLPPHDRAEPR